MCIRDRPRPGLVEVAGEDLAVGAEVSVRRVAGRDRLAPRGSQRGNDRAWEGLVLASFDHIRRQVVLLDRCRRLAAGEPGEGPGRALQSTVIGLPAVLIRLRERTRVVLNGRLR